MSRSELEARLRSPAITTVTGLLLAFYDYMVTLRWLDTAGNLTKGTSANGALLRSSFGAAKSEKAGEVIYPNLYTMKSTDENGEPCLKLTAGYVKRGSKNFMIPDTELAFPTADQVVYIAVNLVDATATVTVGTELPDDDADHDYIIRANVSSKANPPVEGEDQAYTVTVNKTYHGNDTDSGRIF